MDISIKYRSKSNRVHHIRQYSISNVVHKVNFIIYQIYKIYAFLKYILKQKKMQLKNNLASANTCEVAH